VKVHWSALVVAALVTLGACKAERVLAVASSPSGSGGAAGGSSGSSGGGSAGSSSVGSGGSSSVGSGGSSGGTTGNQTDAGGTFGTPQVVTGLRSDTDDVLDPTMTFEQLEIYFASPTGGQTDIWVSTRTVATDPWGPSTLVAELSSPQNDQGPEVTVDGLTMYLASDRGGSGMRIYVSQRRTRDTPWATPTPVSSLGTSTLDEAPGLDRSQLNLAFASQRGTATDAHLFSATRPDTSAAWQNIAELSALNSAWQDTDPALFSNGAGLVFASRRLTQGGTSDLFEAARPDETSPFASLAPITALNTSFNEEGPWLSQDGTLILFASDRSGHYRIYQASR
jgi:Tol biopolymer transport system component